MSLVQEKPEICYNFAQLRVIFRRTVAVRTCYFATIQVISKHICIVLNLHLSTRQMYRYNF